MSQNLSVDQPPNNSRVPAHAHPDGNVIEALRVELGRALLVAGEIPARNERDWSSTVSIRPLAVARPDSPAQVAAVLRTCSAYSVPVVPQGGLTGLCGGAQPSADCIVLSLERLAGIEEIDVAASTMTVRAGTTLEAAQKAAQEAGLFLPLDLGARGSCTIGGNLSTNAGGNRVLRYGMVRQMVLGIEVALADGTLMTSLNKMLKNNAGYDNKQLFIGSEGTLGVITRAVLRLSPEPRSSFTAMCGLPDYDAVLQFLARARQELGPFLSAFEVMWADFIDTAFTHVPGVPRPLDGRHAFHVLLEAQGTDASTDPARFQAWLEAQLEFGIVEDAAIAQSLSQVDAFWTLRDAAAEFRPAIGPFVGYDIGLPVGDIDEYAQVCRRTLANEIPGCLCCFLGHIADGNVHIVAYVPGVSRQPDEAIDAIVYRLVREFNGTISAEHGIGLKKKQYLSCSRSPEEIGLMRMLKSALDPRGILNPGKVF